MQKIPFFRLIIYIYSVSLLITSCTPVQSIAPVKITSTATNPPATPTITPYAVQNTATQAHQVIKTTTQTPLMPSNTPSITPTSQWIFNEPGEIDAPILLYHHIEGETSTSRYQVSVLDFREQMNTLIELGFSPIPISLFLDALIEGKEIPAKPIVITFDDGHESVYENAFPIMNELGFPGVFYIVSNRINNSPGFVNTEELKEMVEAGWEIGSHGYTHADLTINHDGVYDEVAYSKIDLEKALSTSVETFAYPFGKIDPFVAEKVINVQYRAGLGLGKFTTHTLNTLFYLDRIEIHGDFSLDYFKALLLQN